MSLKGFLIAVQADTHGGVVVLILLIVALAHGIPQLLHLGGADQIVVEADVIQLAGDELG